jgi:hypothetical protein
MDPIFQVLQQVVIAEVADHENIERPLRVPEKSTSQW